MTRELDSIEREIDRLLDWKIAVAFGKVKVKDKRRTLNKLLSIQEYWIWQREQFVEIVRQSLDRLLTDFV
jgi:Uma2 family endonuclease